MKIKNILIALLFFICVTEYAFCGGGYELKCQNPECKFEDKIYLGVGMAGREKITGFCAQCGKFVSIDKIKDAELKPLGKIWCSQTGKFLELYECPFCQKPFAKLIFPIKFCPKCESETIKLFEFKWD